MATPVIEAMARALIAAEYGVLANQDSVPIAMERMRKSAVFVLKVLEENITDDMADAATLVPVYTDLGQMTALNWGEAREVFTAMLRAARGECQ